MSTNITQIYLYNVLSGNSACNLYTDNNNINFNDIFSTITVLGQRYWRAHGTGMTGVSLSFNHSTAFAFA